MPGRKRGKPGKPAKKRPSHARARTRGEPAPLTPNQRRSLEIDAAVLEIIRMKTGNGWTPGVSELDLAEKHGVALETVREWSQQATRFIRISLDPEEMKALYVNEAEHVRRNALQRTTQRRQSYRRKDPRTGKVQTYYRHIEVPDPDHRAVLKAIEVKSRLLGIYRQTIELETKRDEFDGWTEQEILEFVASGAMPSRLKANAVPTES